MINRIWIDADGCPVVKQSITIAKKNACPITLVKNYAVHFSDPYAEIVTVDIERDAADFYITNHMGQGDLVVTSDYGLSALVLAKGGLVLSAKGQEITSGNIDFLLESRHEHRVMRQQKQKSKQGKIKKRSPEDDALFENELQRIITRNK